MLTMFFSIASAVLLSHVMMRAMLVPGMLKVEEDYLRYCLILVGLLHFDTSRG